MGDKKKRSKKEREDELRPFKFRKGYQGEPLPPGARPPKQASGDVPAKRAGGR